MSNDDALVSAVSVKMVLVWPKGATAPVAVPVGGWTLSGSIDVRGVDFPYDSYITVHPVTFGVKGDRPGERTHHLVELDIQQRIAHYERGEWRWAGPAWDFSKE